MLLQGYRLNATRILYALENINIGPNQVITRNLTANFDAFEFVFTTSGPAEASTQISVWGRDVAGQLVAAHRVVSDELLGSNQGVQGPQGPQGSTGATGAQGPAPLALKVLRAVLMPLALKAPKANKVLKVQATSYGEKKRYSGQTPVHPDQVTAPLSIHSTLCRPPLQLTQAVLWQSHSGCVQGWLF